MNIKNTTLILFCIFAYSFKTIAQSFQQGSMIINLNYGVEAYHTEYRYKLNNSYINKDTTIKDAAGNSHLILGFEYGALKWLGIGLKLKINNYFSEKDKITGFQPTAHSTDYTLTFRAHLIRAKYFDLPLGISIGGSSLIYKNGNPYFPITVYGSGIFYDFHIQPMVYFGRLGLNMYLGIPYVNYKNMTTDNKTINDTFILAWKGNGAFNLGIGIQYRIIN